MSTSNTTLASLWDDGQSSPIKILQSTPTKAGPSAELREDFARVYRASGLDVVAKEHGILDANGDLRAQTVVQKSNPAVQLVAVPINSPIKMSPSRNQQQAVQRTSLQQNVLTTQQQKMSMSPQVIHNVPSPSTPSYDYARKRYPGAEIVIETEYGEVKRTKKGDKGGKGLRHFSMKVCEKVQRKGVTSYNEVADELVNEFSDPRNLSSPSEAQYDQKNIRRRVYDALNVLMAMNIISKEKKEIRWIGLPTNSAQECQNLELEKQKKMERIKHKTQQLQELILQQIAFKNLVQRNRELEKSQGTPSPNSAIQLPYIIVNTSKKTVIDCSISKDKDEYLFNFDNTFEIHDDIEVLKRMGMTFGLEKGQCSQADLNKSLKMVPKALEPYVLELARGSMANTASGIRPITSGNSPPSTSRYKSSSSSTSSQISSSHQAHHNNGNSTDAMDIEVAMTTGHSVMSRDSSMGSYSDTHSRGVTETPSEDFSNDSDYEASSPIEIIS